MKKHTIKPIIDQQSKIMILGSFPSVKSRKSSFYYMHPENRFWKVLEAIYQDDFTTEDIEKKKRLLHKHHIALFDVIQSCDIMGSKDSSIESVIVNPIPALINHTDIQHLYLNGRKAESLFNQYFPEYKDQSTYLPSTSPANARYRINDLVEAWEIIKPKRG